MTNFAVSVQAKCGLAVHLLLGVDDVVILYVFDHFAAFAG